MQGFTIYNAKKSQNFFIKIKILNSFGIKNISYLFVLKDV